MCSTIYYQNNCCTSIKITKNACAQHIFAQKNCNKDYLFYCACDTILCVSQVYCFIQSTIIDYVCLWLLRSRFARLTEQIIATCTKQPQNITTINYPLNKQILMTQQNNIIYTKYK